MPNLVPPVSNAAQALAYKSRIMAAQAHCERQVEPLMVIYLTDNTTPDDIRQARDAGVVACKLYPAGATTNSDSGVTNLRKVYPALEAMQEANMRFLMHGEVTDAEIDIFDREKVFIDRVLLELGEQFPELPMVLEHITTADAVSYVTDANHEIAATITAHHLLYNRNDMLVGGIRPHYYCLPVAKRESHRLALRAAATSGNGKYFLGTDSAPHTDANKLSACGCAGCFTATNTMPLLAHVFEEDNALDQLEKFASLNGPAFYRMAPNEATLTLSKGDVNTFPTHIETPDGPVTVFDPGFPVHWHASAS